MHNPLLDDILGMELHSDPDTSEDEDPLVRHTSFNIAKDSRNPHFDVGKKFGTKKEFKATLKKLCNRDWQNNLHVYKTRLRVKCRHPNCKQYMSASQVPTLGTSSFV